MFKPARKLGRITKDLSKEGDERGVPGVRQLISGDNPSTFGEEP